MNDPQYAGFWIRTLAALIDSMLVLFVLAPLLTFFYGADYWLTGGMGTGLLGIVLNYLLPAFAVILFWIYKSATPGKMVLKLTIVDATNQGKPSVGQLVGRYFAYYISMLPFFLGMIWVGIDNRKQGWHDKLAGTVV